MQGRGSRLREGAWGCGEGFRSEKGAPGTGEDRGVVCRGAWASCLQRRGDSSWTMVQDLCGQQRDLGVPGSQPMGPGQTWGGSWKEQVGEAEGIPWGAHCPLHLSSPESLLPPPFSWPVFFGGLWTPKPLAPAWPIVPFHRLLGGPCPGPLIQRPDRGSWEHQARTGPLGWESRAHRLWSPVASWWGLR